MDQGLDMEHDDGGGNGALVLDEVAQLEELGWGQGLAGQPRSGSGFDSDSGQSVPGPKSTESVVGFRQELKHTHLTLNNLDDFC